MTTIQCMRIVEFDAAHRVLGHESKCRTLHGHRYKVELYAQADELDSVGRVIDFSVLKQKVGGWLDEHWDHTTILSVQDPLFEAINSDPIAYKKPSSVPFNPTAEEMARWILEIVCPMVLQDSGVVVRKVVVWETPLCKAVAVLP